jgi:tetratricopeptide (TPR) repeat protein
LNGSHIPVAGLAGGLMTLGQPNEAHMNKIKVLFLAANPTDTTKLRLDEEIRQIANKIREAEYRDALELISAWAVRPDDMLLLLNLHKPHIVHFSGHGDASGEIILTDNAGVSKPVTAEAIKALFTTLKDNVRVVVLNACYSKAQAEAITEVIDCAIGMRTRVVDEAAIAFAASFYRAVGFGRSIQQAFDQGKVALLLEGFHDKPDLIHNSQIAPSEIVLVRTDSDTTYADERIELARDKIRQWGQRITLQQQWDDHCWHLLGHGLEYTSEAIETNPNYPRPWILLADIYHLIGKSELARKCLDKSFYLGKSASDLPVHFYRYVENRIKTGYPFDKTGGVERASAPSWFEVKYKRYWTFVGKME